jgi:hypothetical protein
MTGDLPDLLDELYALPLERFVPERALLAKALRAEGRRDEASTIAALPKPSVVAWAVNQVVRAHPGDASALWAAGDAVLDAQARVVAGEGSGQALRAAVDEERRALAPLAEAARGLLTGAGRFLGEHNVRVVVETLHAAAVDRAVRPDVARGRLARPLQLAGVGTSGAEEGSPPAPARQAPRPGPRARQEPSPEDEAARRRAEREARARREAAGRALVRAERDRNAARERIAKAVERRDRARAAVEDARRALAAAEEELTRAEGSVGTAHAALEVAEDAADAARAEAEGG